MKNNFLNTIRAIRKFITTDIWIANLSSYGKVRAFFLGILKVVLIVINDFFKDKCLLRASSLTYYFFLAIVPFFAVAFAVLKGFGFQNTYGELFLSSILLNQEVSQKAISYISNTNMDALGIFGAVILILTAVFLLLNIERSFNDIWGVREKRPFIRKLIYYLFAIIVFPLFITVVLSAISTALGDISIWSSRSAAYPMTLVFLTSLYIFMTNEKVKFVPALCGGAVAAGLWFYAQSLYVSWSKIAQEYNIIYGGFSQVVLVFVWIYINWIIVLLGAEAAFAIQNLSSYQKAGKAENISFSFKEKLALLILNLIYSRFEEGSPPLSSEDIIYETRGPVKMINQLLLELTGLGILIENHMDNKRYYTPAKNTEKITVPYVLKIMRSYGIEDIPLRRSGTLQKISDMRNEIFSHIEEEYGSFKVTDL